MREEIYSFYIHSCWPFIEVGLFCSIGKTCAEQEGLLLSTETQINCPLNQINAHLKWTVSLSSLKTSEHISNLNKAQKQLLSIHQSFVFRLLFADVQVKEEMTHN